MATQQQVAVMRLTRSTPKRYRTFRGRKLRARYGRGGEFVEWYNQLQHFKAKRQATAADQELLWADQYEPWHHCTCMWCSNQNEIEITDTMVEAADREREAFGR